MFLNREEAGMRLSVLLLKEGKFESAVVVAIPRGGIVVGELVSKVLRVPLAALIVKKIGAPGNPELAIGATGPPVGGDSVVFWDELLIKSLKISPEEKKDALFATIKTIKAREKILKLPRLRARNKTAIVVDDGVATGATAIAASLILKKLGSKKNILATPVISKHTKKEIKKYFDKIISVITPSDFSAVGQFYREFPQVEDEEVRDLLHRSNN